MSKLEKGDTATSSLPIKLDVKSQTRKWCEYSLESYYPNFNTIIIPHLPPLSNYENCVISVSSVTVTNVIRTLTKDDFIVIDSKKYILDAEMTSQHPEYIVELLNLRMVESGVEAKLDSCEIIYFKSNREFVINTMSYNLSLLLGVKQLDLPVRSVENKIKMNSYGDYNSTPLLYLLSNLGSNMYVQKYMETETGLRGIMASHQIFMRFNNSYSPNLPITYIGGEYKRIANVSALTSGGFIQIVDSNLVPLDLLYPMRLSLYVSFF